MKQIYHFKEHRDKISKLIQNLKSSGYSIAVSNGCFDILHPAHIDSLNRAKEYAKEHYLRYCDSSQKANIKAILIVGLNSDSSIKRLKGPDRPIFNEKDRALMLLGLGCADYVIIFNEDTPKKLLEVLKPNFLIKGGNYSVAEVIGGDIVKRHGGEVKVTKYLNRYSSTDIIEKIKKLK